MFYRIRRIFSKLKVKFHTEYWYEHNLIIPEGLKRPEDVSLDFMSIEKLPELHSIWNLDLNEMKRRLEDGHICFTPRVNGEIAGYHWLQVNGVHYMQPTGITVNINPHESMIYHGRVSSKFQSRGIGGFVYLSILNYAIEHKLNKVLVYTAAKNIANQKSLSKVGFNLTKKYHSIQLNGHSYKLFSQSV